MVILTVDKAKLLGVIIDYKLKFDEHVKSLCLKTNRNISTLSRVAKIVDQTKCKLLYISFVITSGILLSSGWSVEKLLIKKLTGFINEHLVSY